MAGEQAGPFVSGAETGGGLVCRGRHLTQALAHERSMRIDR
jgi:hypothetical protein